jgi:uncharacterized protein
MPVLCPRRARASTAILIADPSYQRFDSKAGIARIIGSIMKAGPNLSLEAIVDEPLRFDFEVPFAADELAREPLADISSAHIAGEVTRVEGGYSLSAWLSWVGKLECSRCLAPYDFVEEEEFSLLLYRRAPVAEAELSLDKDDLDAYFYDEPIVPVAPIVEERIQIAIPMKPLCREDCRGLCPQCGGDRNVSECNCVVEFIDPRWRALQLLRKDR